MKLRIRLRMKGGKLLGSRVVEVPPQARHRARRHVARV
jgi:hypothetical protein